MSKFSPVQQQTVERAYQQLGEQFEGVLIVVLANLDPESHEEAQECVQAFYAGGRTQALGLAAEAMHVIQNGSREREVEP